VVIVLKELVHSNSLGLISQTKREDIMQDIPNVLVVVFATVTQDFVNVSLGMKVKDVREQRVQMTALVMVFVLTLKTLALKVHDMNGRMLNCMIPTALI
jgi:hypothetical protein